MMVKVGAQMQSNLLERRFVDGVRPMRVGGEAHAALIPCASLDERYHA